MDRSGSKLRVRWRAGHQIAVAVVAQPGSRDPRWQSAHPWLPGRRRATCRALKSVLSSSRMRQIGRASKDRFGWLFQLPVDVDDLGSASGSPVLDVHGRVVGVFFMAASNMATALSVEHLRAFGWHREGTDWVSCHRRSFRLCHEAAVENVRARARQKNPIAQSRQWHLYTNDVIDGDIAVLDSLKEAASQGLRSAQLLLAFAYHDGDFVVADRTLRDLWYTRAAEQDDPLAQYNMAASIRRSEPNRARSWLEPLAERGFVPAKKLLQKIQ